VKRAQRTRVSWLQVYYFPSFGAQRDGVKLRHDLTRNLLRETGWEAVMRIRCSRGLRVSSFHGHFFIRSTDLLALPVVDGDKAYAVQIAHEENVMPTQHAYVQVGVANPRARVVTSKADPRARVTTSKANPRARVTTSKANPRARVTTSKADPRASARVDLEVSAGWVSPSSRGLWGGDGRRTRGQRRNTVRN
jgi:hypothetical protein